MGDSFAALWQQLSARGADADLDTAIEAFAIHEPGGLPTALLQAELQRRQGRHQQALQRLTALDPAQLEQAGQHDPKLLALHLHTLGLLRREQGDFQKAARDFIDSFARDPELLASLHALQFTRLSPAELPPLCALFDQAVQSCRQAPPLALQLLADWQQQLGERTESCALSYRAAQASVAAHQRDRLDRLNPPNLPEALIVGAPKCGTTSLAGWLTQHPRVFVHPRKELHFFDNRWAWGADWYRCQFPRFDAAGPGIVRLEATPNYLQLADVPERAWQLMPEARLIVLLRHPVERALSWCQHIIRQEGVKESPEQIISAELELLRSGEARAWIEGGEWHPTNCLFGSLYGRQLARWQRRFPEDQLLVLQMEQCLKEPQASWEGITEFLGLETDQPPSVPPMPRLNAAPAYYRCIPADLWKDLEKALETDLELWNQLRTSP